MDHRIVSHPEISLVGWTTTTTSSGGNNRRDIPFFWQRCSIEGKVGALMPLVGPLGLVGLCTEMVGDAFTYVIGVENPAGLPPPEGTRSFHLAASTYAVFASVGALPFALQATWDQAFSQGLAQARLVPTGNPNFEVYPVFPPGDLRGDPTSERFTCEVWIAVNAPPVGL